LPSVDVGSSPSLKINKSIQIFKENENTLHLARTPITHQTAVTIEIP